LGKVGIDAPIARAIGIGQRAMGDRRTKPHMIELVGSRTEAHFKIGQALAVSHLGEGHGEELLPAREAYYLIITAVAIDAATKLLVVDQPRDLGENGFSCAHSARLAENLLRETRKSSSDRAHPRCAPTPLE